MRLYGSLGCWWIGTSSSNHWSSAAKSTLTRSLSSVVLKMRILSVLFLPAERVPKCTVSPVEGTEEVLVRLAYLLMAEMGT